MSERWRENTGKAPHDLRGRGKRVVVELRNGRICGEQPVSSATPPGWAIDGQPPPRWTLTGDDFDIVKFRVL